MNGKLHKEYIKNNTGAKYGKLLIVKIVRGKNSQSECYCTCDCNPNEIVKNKDGTLKKFKLLKLRNGVTTSCGCYNRQRTKETHKKYNEYIRVDNSTIKGKFSNNNLFFIFDAEDFDLIKDYCWCLSVRGYVESNLNGKCIKFHQLILNRINIKDKKVIDHINRNPLDNKKENLRIINSSKNGMNKSKQSNNKSGFTGIHFDNKRNLGWIVQIAKNKKHYYIGSFKNLEDAIISRLRAELQYFGKEFAPQRHLFEEYGIE